MRNVLKAIAIIIPGMNLFFVFDESTAYLEAIESGNAMKHIGDSVCGRPHFFFADATFLDVVKHSNADYFFGSLLLSMIIWLRTGYFFRKP